MRPIALLLFALAVGAAAATVAQAAPEPPLVRLTAYGSGHYMDHGGGNKTTVFATSTTPIEQASNGDALVTNGPDMWHLVDWNGGRLLSGDQVSFATQAVKEPYYLRSTSCEPSAKPNTQKRATMSSGLGTSDMFTIHGVSGRLSCSRGAPCLWTMSLAEDGTPIENGSAVAIETPQGCFLYESDSTAVLGDRTAFSNVAPQPVWRLWFKVIPRDDDDFPGHADDCFGGAGAGCWTNPSWPLSGMGTWRTRASGNGYESFKTIDTSIGSITHDNCCIRNPLGKNCGGVFSGAQHMTDGTAPPKGVMAVFPGGEVWQGTRCEWEWQRAADNLVLLTQWAHEFGPYYSDATRACPGCKVKGEQGWGLSSDQLFLSNTTRQAWLFNQLTWRKWIAGMPPSHYADGTNEVDKTEVLSAPTGTHIYPNGIYSDESILGDFCSNRTAYWDVWTSAWVCAEIQCTSGIAYWTPWSGWTCE